MNRKIIRALASSLMFTLVLSAVCLGLDWTVEADSAINVPDDRSSRSSASTLSGSSSTPWRDYWPTMGWRTSTPEAHGMNSTKLSEMVEYIEDNPSLNPESVVVVRHGYVLLEYDAHPEYDALGNLYSVTKSFSSALIGIAIQKGYIDSVEHKVLDFFPNRIVANVDSRKQNMTLEHLLTMTSGMQWDEWTDNDVYDMMRSRDWVQFVLDRPVAYDPGTVWTYNSGGSHLLSAIIGETTGNNTIDFAVEHLFNLLGISRLEWATDPQGLSQGFSSLYLSPLDMAKFGFLYLNNGIWDDQEIVPAEWVVKSTESLFWLGQGTGYGYQWWIDPDAGMYSARGSHGQYICVLPDYDMVVVTTECSDPEMVLFNYILPAVTGQDVFVPDDFPTIQGAINNASDGDMIFVRAGTYYENVVVNKTISLIGENASTTIIDGNQIGHVVVITSDNVSVTGFTVQNSGTAYHITGINLNNANYCYIHKNIMTNNEHGLELHNSSNYNTISENNITENNKWGMHIIQSHYNNVSGNTIGGSLWGSIAIHGLSTHNQIHDNYMGNNDNVGVNVDDSNYNSIYGNNITCNMWGVSVQYGASYNTVSRNNIFNNEYGIKLEWNILSNAFYHNNFIDNNFQTSVIGYNYANSWDNGYPFGGNFWSDYGGVDSYSGSGQNVPGSDGICDSVYEINANNVDNYPLMEPWVSVDIAVLNVSASKDFVGRGGKIDFELVVRNRGNKTENVEVRFYVNGTFIHFQQFLASNRYYLFYQFTWDTNGFAYGNYTVTAVLEPLEAEKNVADNTFNCSVVKVTILGDVNGDFKVQLDDLMLLAQAYGTQPGDALWNSDADVDGDGEVRLVDVVTLAYNYGKHYP